MKYLETAVYDPDEKQSEEVILLGSFPGHIVNMNEGKNINGSIPYNYVIRIAPEAADLKGINWKARARYLKEIEGSEEEDKGPEAFLETVKDNNMVNKEINSTGVWLTLEPKKGQNIRKARDRRRNRSSWNILYRIRSRNTKN